MSESLDLSDVPSRSGRVEGSGSRVSTDYRLRPDPLESCVPRKRWRRNLQSLHLKIGSLCSLSVPCQSRYFPGGFWNVPLWKDTEPLFFTEIGRFKSKKIVLLHWKEGAASPSYCLSSFSFPWRSWNSTPSPVKNEKEPPIKTRERILRFRVWFDLDGFIYLNNLHGTSTQKYIEPS